MSSITSQMYILGIFKIHQLHPWL